MDIYNHPKVLEAKQLLLSVLRDEQRKITGVKPANADLKEEYEAALGALNHIRTYPMFYPYLGSGLGNGPLVQLLDGSVKYDFIGGIGPAYLGHSDLDSLGVRIDAALTDTVMQGNLQQNIDPLHYMQKLLEASGMDHCFLSTSGAMATENGLKVAFHYKRSATRVLAFENCFMGRTLALAQVTDKAAYRYGLPNTLPVDYLPFYSDEGSTENAVKLLRKYIERYPGLHGAMCFELIQGEGGFNVGTHHFFKALMRVLKECDIPVIADEVQTFGRTTELFAYDYFDLREYVDIVSIGKIAKCCATLFTNRLKPKGGLLGQTFMGSTSSIKHSLYVLKGFLEGDYLKKNGECFEACRKLIEHLKAKHPGKIQGPYGVGSMVAVTIGDGDPEKTRQFAKKLFQEGLIAFTAGKDVMRIRMLIPVPALREGDLEKAFAILDRVLEKES